jgi:hypothetical protein
MTFTKTLLATAFALAASGATAATFNNVSGNVCEGGVRPAPGVCNPGGGDLTIGDFDSNITDPTLNIVGDTHIFGGVAHRDTGLARFQDNFTLNLGAKTYAATFNWQAVSANFDGEIVVGGTAYSFTTPPSSGSITIGNLTGDNIAFIIDPIAGIFPDTPDEVGTWDLELSQVPLPASALLLIAGVGGLGALRRFGRKS